MSLEEILLLTKYIGDWVKVESSIVSRPYVIRRLTVSYPRGHSGLQLGRQSLYHSILDSWKGPLRPLYRHTNLVVTVKK